MALLFKCDFCKKLFCLKHEEDARFFSKIDLDIAIGGKKYVNNGRYELCEKCAKNITEYITEHITI